MRPDGIVDTLPFNELLVEFLDGPGTVINLVELFGMSAVSPFDGSVKFRINLDPTLRTQLWTRFPNRRVPRSNTNNEVNGPDPIAQPPSLGVEQR